MTTKTQTSQSNALGDPTQSLQTFDLTDLQQYTREKSYATTASKDFHLFYNTYFVVGQSATHQISHTKGFVADGKVGGEGSTNWSASGEGTFVVQGQPGGKGYKAQNNTQSIFTDPDTITRFQSELIAEHMAARVQNTRNLAEGARRGAPRR
jgi:hypothetical protein